MNPIIAEAQFYTSVVWITVVILGIVLFWDILYIARRKKGHHTAKKFFPKASLIIPAFNEGKVLGKTLQKILDSRYPRNNLEVIVVDDGSTDDTEKVAKKFGVRLIKNAANLGKCESLNVGIKNASNEIIITTDADTEFEKDTIENLVKHFSDEGVGAVAGYYKALPFKNVLTNFSLNKLKTFFLVKFQSLEYLLFLFARRRQAAFDAVMVVPGSIGAFRKNVLQEIGGFDSGMLIEDYDATVKIHKAGYKVVCEKNALAWTKAPTSFYELFKQRFRWYKGGFEVLSKHSGMITSRHGFVGIILGFEYITIFLQLIMLSFVGAVLYEQAVLLHQNILQLLWNWVHGFIHFRPIDVFGGIIISMFAVGLAEAYVSVKMSRDSLKNLFFYLISMPYLSVLGFIWLYSLVAHVTKRKTELRGRGWKTSIKIV